MAHCKHCKQEIRLGGPEHRCQEQSDAATEGLMARRSAAACSALPVEAGFYWWRKYSDQEWRMVHIVDFAAGYPDEPPHLTAYDIEYRAWSGRTLSMWAIHDPNGEWMPCRKPNVPVVAPATLEPESKNDVMAG